MKKRKLSKQKVRKLSWMQLRRRVKRAGGIPLKKGATSHNKWRLPNGRIVILEYKHRKRLAPAKRTKEVLQAIKACRQKK